MKKILVVLLAMCCALPVMAKKRQNEEIITPLTQLEKRQFQTKTYSAQDNILAMKSILNVLQDEGFIVYNVNSLLGYIYGVKDFDISDPNVDISKEFGLTKSRLNYNGVKVATLEVSINVTQYGEQSRIRANFKRKLFNEYGNAQMIEDIDDAEFYSEFYKKVDSAIALQKEIANKVKKEETPVSVKRPITKPPVRRPVPKPEPVVTPQSEEVQPQTEVQSQEAANKPVEITTEPAKSNETAKTEEVPQEQTPQIKTESVMVEKEVKSPKQESAAPEYTPEQILEFVPVDTEPEHVKTPKEIKELVKKAKLEAKQAQKEAIQAQKEALRLQKDLDNQAEQAEKEALKSEKETQKKLLQEEKKVLKEAQKEAKRQAKEMRE